MRRSLALALSALLPLLLLSPAGALYMRPDIVNVPIPRVLENLEAKAKKEPKSVPVRLNLARAHAMAYASKSDTAPTLKGKGDQGVWFGFEPKLVPFEVKKSEDPVRLKDAQAHLKHALTWYDEVLKLDGNNLSGLLGRAWVLQQSGEKEKAIAAYRDTIKKAWESEKNLKAGRLGGRYYTAEAGDYLVTLLDADKDRAEIAELKDRGAQLRKLPRPITPVAVPLEDGLAPGDLVDPAARVAFDVDGTGLARRWTWLTPRAAWLVYDPRQSGRVTSGLQMFGSVTFWMFWDDGYQALSALDDDGDGTLRGKELAGLALWHDRNGDGVCDPGEVRPLSSWGITALSCRADDTPPAGCAAWSRSGVTLTGGRVRPTYDVILQSR